MQIGIRSKLKLISLLPILLLLGFASYFLYQSANSYLRGQAFSESTVYSDTLNDLATQLAKERGMTSIYLASSGKKLKASLQKQRARTDQSVQTLKKYLSAHPNVHARQALMQLLAQLPQKRQQVDTLKISFRDIFFKYYTVLIKEILYDIDEIASSAPNNEIVNESKAYIGLARAKEASGIERGFMSFILTRYTKMSDEELQTWIHYIGQADTYEYSFILDKNLKAQLDKILLSEEARETMSDLADARIEILHSINDGYYTIDPTLWFNLNTEKISILGKAQKALLASINQKTANMLQEQMYIAGASAALWLVALILAIIGFIVSREITRNVKNLETILQNVADLTDSQMDINLDTAEGTAQAYALLQNVIEETRKEQQRAEEANEAKSLFLANMSHEIRTPLNGIVGFTELLRNTKLTDEQKEFVDIIEKSSENLLEIINNILDLSKIESNKVEIENIVFNPIDEFESAVDIYAVKAAEKQIDLACFIDPSLENPIKGDPTKIKEILINLLSNAVKFTNQGGAIDVEIRREETDSEGKCRISFSVKDTGIGISPDKKAHIFEAFSQADISVTRKFGGTGLGLTISARYAELMGGKLDLESEVGEGTRFFFTLEFEELPTMNETKKGAYSNVALGILTPLGRSKKQDEYLREYLRYYGVSYTEFATPEELFSLIKTKSIISALIDSAYASDSELRKMGKAPIHCNVLIKSTHQKRIEALRNLCEKIIYEPLTGTKLISVLEGATQEAPKPKKQTVIDSDKIRFKAKALVAEDNVINQKLILRTLEGLGMQVDLAANGLEAFEKRRNGDYDVIFMDISMPVMDGVEATHEILDYEEDEELPHIPIIALTANALKGDRERFLAEGLDEYTTKPLVKEEIIAILKKFLSDKITTQDAIEAETPLVDKEPPKEQTKEEEPLAFDAQPQEEEKSEPRKQRGQQIIVLKKSPLEGKIFENLLKQTGYDVSTAQDFEDLLNKINPDTGLVFVDYETEELDLQALKDQIDKLHSATAVILMADPSSEVPEEVASLSDERISNIVTRDLARLIIEKFIQK